MSIGVPSNFFVKRNSVVSAYIVPWIMGIGVKTPEDAKDYVGYGDRLSGEYYPSNQKAIEKYGPEIVLRKHLKNLFQKSKIHHKLTNILGETFYKPDDCMSGVFMVDLTENMGLNAYPDGVSINHECVVMVDRFIKGNPTLIQEQEIEIKMISMMAAWRAKRGICYISATNKIIRFELNQQTLEKWWTILTCLRKWAESAYNPVKST